MKMGIVWHCRYPWDVRIEKSVRSIRAAGNEVVLITKGSPGLPVMEEQEGVVHYRLPLWRPPRLLFRCAAAPLFFNPVWLWGIGRIAARERLQALIVRDLPMALPVALLGKLLGIPVILDMAENYPAALLAYQNKLYAPFLFADAWLPRFYEKLALHLVDSVIVVAEEQKERLERLKTGLRRVAIVRNTPEIERLKTLSRVAVNDPVTAGRYVLYSGFMDRHRGMRTLVLAFNEICCCYPDLKLLLIGRGNESASVARLVGELGLDGRVVQKGWLDFSFIPGYIRHSTLCVIPHVKTEHTDTTMPNKIFDYMYFGKPVIVSNAAPLRRMAAEMHSNLVFESGNHRALAELMARVLDGQLPDSVLQRGRELVERKYNWDNDAQNLLHILAITG